VSWFYNRVTTLRFQDSANWHDESLKFVFFGAVATSVLGRTRSMFAQIPGLPLVSVLFLFRFVLQQHSCPQPVPVTRLQRQLISTSAIFPLFLQIIGSSLLLQSPITSSRPITVPKFLFAVLHYINRKKRESCMLIASVSQ